MFRHNEPEAGASARKETLGQTASRDRAAEIGGERSPSGFHFHIDEPIEWSLSSNRTQIRGWCVHSVEGQISGIRVVWPTGEAYGRYGEPRPDVSHAFDLPHELENCGFKVPILLPSGKTTLTLQASARGEDWHELATWDALVPWYTVLPFFRPRSKEDPTSDYEAWIRRFERPNWLQTQSMKLRARRLHYRPLISVLLPTYNTPVNWLCNAIESVRRQTYPNWQLCISDDASTNPGVRKTIQRYVRRDRRITATFRKKNGHISASSNSALKLASGEFVALLDHDDELSRDALYAVALALNRNRELDVIYSDEDKINQYGTRFDPHFKSDWNPDLLTGQNCVSHLGVFRTSRLREIGGFRTGMEGCQDWDVALRLTEKISPHKVHHIPRMLYHWRAIPGSTALALDEKNYIRRSGHRMLTDYFAQQRVAAEVSAVKGGHWRIKYPLVDSPLVTIIIPTRDKCDLLKRCVESIHTRTTYRNYELLIVDNESQEPDALAYLAQLESSAETTVLRYHQPFNYSAINNLAAQRARGSVLCFLNNDIEITTPDWLEEMVSHALRPEIGAVGAQLLFPDDTLQHTGIVLGLGGPAGHVLYRFHSNTGGYYNHARLLCNYTAVTAACMVIRKTLFQRAGKFDEQNLAISYSDVDLCIRIAQLGYRNLYTPFSRHYHHESKSRGSDSSQTNAHRAASERDYMWRRWGVLLLHDPAYNPSLSLIREDYSLAVPPRVRPIWQAHLGDAKPLSADEAAHAPAYWSRPISRARERAATGTTLASEVASELFRRLLKRTPRADELFELARQLRAGVTVKEIVSDLVASSEFSQHVNTSSPEGSVAVCFLRVLHREPSETELDSGRAVVNQRGAVDLAHRLVHSVEYENRFGANAVPHAESEAAARLSWHAAADAPRCRAAA